MTMPRRIEPSDYWQPGQSIGARAQFWVTSAHDPVTVTTAGWVRAEDPDPMLDHIERTGEQEPLKVPADDRTPAEPDDEEDGQ